MYEFGKVKYPAGKGAYYKARAKINLTLEVGEAREDGFHEVSMIMQSLRLWDDVELFIGKDDHDTIESNIPFFKADEKNIAYRAVLLMRERFHLNKPVHIRLRKKIPIAAGLAGGSADAAAVIKGMNKLFGLRLSTEQLMELGAELGSDIPFCINGGTCLATGRGEKIQQLPALPLTYVVLIKPDFSISTPWAYQAFDKEPKQKKPDYQRMLKIIEDGRLEDMQAEMINMLEAPVVREHPLILELKEKLKEEGAVASAMSGSGPTVYGLFKDEKAAKDAYLKLRNTLPYKYQIIYTNTENPRYQQRCGWK
ncbi:MAG: 4-(cytidine 5'-diphospho)-2-C-methyl-D-erythritol kinase [Firmicutes bacterium]|nr:4-(cytidine 5'-diphospho)-2-C-methyl-D-erythritol kinase [Bacillota bacterium]